MYPLKFEPILKQTLWGGDKIIPFKHLNDTLANVGESWEVSAVEGSESIVANGADKGLTLPDMVRKYKEDPVSYTHLTLPTSDLFRYTRVTSWLRNVITVLVKMKCGMLLLLTRVPS